MKLKSFLRILLLSVFILTACGKKGGLEYPEGQKRAKFDNVIDEE